VFSDPNRYNKPSTTDVAAITVGDEDDQQGGQYDIIVYLKNGSLL
jgi:hypothetical protein